MQHKNDKNKDIQNSWEAAVTKWEEEQSARKVQFPGSSVARTNSPNKESLSSFI